MSIIHKIPYKSIFRVGQRFRCFSISAVQQSEHIDFSMRRPNEREKKWLLKAKMYKSNEEIPEQVSVNQIVKAYDYHRIRRNLYFMLTGFIFLFVIVQYRKVERRQAIREADKYR